MPFTIDVRRADDLLVLRLECVNLTPGPNVAGAPRQLVRADATADAVLIVHLPPQHLAEPRIDDAALEHLVIDQPDALRPALSGPSRLVFRLPDDLASLDLTLDALLDWDRLEPVLPLNDGDEPELVTPTAQQTCIELPFRLRLAPGASGRWRHAAAAAPTTERQVLWHTRLVPATGAATPMLRVVASPDHPSPTANAFVTSLTSDERQQITQLSSDFTILAPERFEHLTPDDLATLPRYAPPPLELSLCMLSALGGWLRCRTRFAFPRLGALVQQLEGHDLDPPGRELFSIDEWRHEATMGRDRDVLTIRRGFLYPLGHQAAVVTTVRRRFVQPLFSAPVGALGTTLRLMVQADTCRYSHADVPFAAVRLLSVTTPPLDAVDPSEPFVPSSGGQPVSFAADAEDRQGGVMACRLPLVFVPEDKVAAPGIEDLYRALATVAMSDQVVAYTARPASGIETRMATRAITLAGRPADAPGAQAPFVPRLHEAVVSLRSLAELTTGHDAMRMRYDPAHLADPARDVFAQILGPAGSPTELAGVAVTLPASVTAGPAAVPTIRLRDLSLTEGALPALDPQQLVADIADARLLGQVPLGALLGPLRSRADFPSLATVVAGGGRTTTFSWTPPLAAALAPPLSALAGGTPALSLRGRVETGAGQTHSAIDGTLTDVAVHCAGVILGFRRIAMHLASGQAPQFDVAIAAIDFEPPLAFVDTLAAALQEVGQGFSGASGPALVVAPDGVTASLTVALPSLAMGVLGLQNVAVAASTTVYFVARPMTVQFALSSREHPFLISYSVFGGGGYFRLAADSAGAVDVEASLEFGAVVAVSLVVASGVAQVMVGIRVTTSDTGLSLSGFVRVFGAVEVLQIVSVSVCLTITLTYQPTPNVLTGRAELVLMVRVLAFSKSVTLTFERSFSLRDGLRSLQDTVSPDQFAAYCAAFA